MIDRTAALTLAVLLAACGSDEAKTPVAPPPSLVQTIAYDCNGIGRVTAIFSGEDKSSVQVDLPNGKSLTLLLVPSASGAHYADAADDSLWSKGSEAMLSMAGKTSSCTEAPRLHP